MGSKHPCVSTNVCFMCTWSHEICFRIGGEIDVSHDQHVPGCHKGKKSHNEEMGNEGMGDATSSHTPVFVKIRYAVRDGEGEKKCANEMSRYAPLIVRYKYAGNTMSAQA